MGLRFCKEGQLVEIIVEDRQEITLLMQKERRNRKAARTPRPKPPPPLPPPPPPPPPPPVEEPGDEKSATKIQAWWRGTLVRRTLLLAALCASVIQRWWRQVLRELPRERQRRRRVMLEAYVRQKRAAVRLQAWVRMWLVRLHYRRLLQAARVIQAGWRCHSCHTSGLLQGRYKLRANQLGLELEIFLGSQICRIAELIPLPIKN